MLGSPRPHGHMDSLAPMQPGVYAPYCGNCLDPVPFLAAVPRTFE